MPSGSRGGGGGSHSGGSRGGGSHFGGGSRRSSHVRTVRNGRTVVYLGSGTSRRYMSSGMYNLMSFLTSIVMIALFLGFSFVMGISNASEQIKTIEEDYAYYQNMIIVAENKANSNIEGYIVYGTVTGVYLKSKDKYYLTYSFVADSGETVKNGYTFSTYEFEDVNNIVVGVTEIKLALEYAPSDVLTDSIDYDYKFTTLEDDIEYVEAVDSKSKLTTYSIIAGVATTAILVAVIVIKTKGSKKEENEAASNQEVKQQVPKKNHCKYCGSVVLDGKTSCDNCGAGIYSDSDLV